MASIDSNAYTKTANYIKTVLWYEGQKQTSDANKTEIDSHKVVTDHMISTPMV